MAAWPLEAQCLLAACTLRQPRHPAGTSSRSARPSPRPARPAHLCCQRKVNHLCHQAWGKARRGAARLIGVQQAECEGGHGQADAPGLAAEACLLQCSSARVGVCSSLKRSWAERKATAAWATCCTVPAYTPPSASLLVGAALGEEPTPTQPSGHSARLSRFCRPSPTPVTSRMLAARSCMANASRSAPPGKLPGLPPPAGAWLDAMAKEKACPSEPSSDLASKNSSTSS